MLKKLFILVIPALLAGTLTSAEGPVKEFTFPRKPQRDALDRLALNIAWHIKVPTDKNRDGIFDIQVIPGPRHPQILLQTFAGAAMLIDGETGDLIWRNQPGPPYWTLQPPSFNSHSIFTTAQNHLFILSRATGAQRYHEPIPGTKERRHGFTLASGPSAGSVADEEGLYFVMGNRAIAYNIPSYGLGDKLKEAPRKPGEDAVDVSAPVFRWSSTYPGTRFYHPPLLTIERLGLAGQDGTFLSVNKFERGGVLDFKTQGPVDAAPGQHTNIAYIGARDYAVYAVDILRTVLLWRFLSGGPIQRKPHVNDQNVYFFASRQGMYCLDRLTGRELWRNATSEQFLAANQKFVYTRNHNGTLMVLDGTRGTPLAHYDFQDWKVAVANEITDRIYLANHDGQILCLHHRNNPTPLKMKTVKLRVKREEKIDDKKPPLKEDKKEDKEDMKEDKKEKEKVKEKEKDQALAPQPFDDAPFREFASQPRLIAAFSSRKIIPPVTRLLLGNN